MIAESVRCTPCAVGIGLWARPVTAGAFCWGSPNGAGLAPHICAEERLWAAASRDRAVLSPQGSRRCIPRASLDEAHTTRRQEFQNDPRAHRREFQTDVVVDLLPSHPHRSPTHAWCSSLLPSVCACTSVLIAALICSGNSGQTATISATSDGRGVGQVGPDSGLPGVH
jgi:hypothetical protein